MKEKVSIKLVKKIIVSDNDKKAQGKFDIKKPIIIMGGAKCVWDDLKKAKKLIEKHDLAAVNDIGVHYPERIHHWLSLERRISEWYEQRNNNHHPMDVLVHVYYHDRLLDHKRHINYFWKMEKSPIMSGVFGPIALKALGYKRIILAGIPSDKQPRFFDPPDKDYHPWKCSQGSWLNHKDYFDDTLRSMSGFTKEVFGEPTKEWLGDKK